MNALSWRLPGLLLGVFLAIWIALAIAPISRPDWLLENMLVFVSVPVLVFTRQRLRFSNLSYWCLFAFLVFHVIGSHYTYSLVPYDEWWRALTGSTLNEHFGWERNHYDRVAHFLYGLLIIPPAVELFDAVAPPQTATWRWLMPLTFVTSHAVVYELIEWIAALIVAPELGDAYLGTQGDHWDAQKDMALAVAGSILALVLLNLRPRQFARHLSATD